MKSQVLSNFTWTDLTVIAFVIFLSFFSFVVIWTFRKNSKAYYEEIGSIVFDEGMKNEQ